MSASPNAPPTRPTARILALALLAGGAYLLAESGGLLEFLDPETLADRIR